MFAGGYSGTDGIFHTGIGPFDGDGVGVGYGTMRYTRGALKFNFFTNQLNGDALGLLAIGTDGQPILFKFNTKTYDVELGNINAIGTRNVLSYGGNVRFNKFDLSIAPRGDSRTELGVYVQDEIFLNDYVRLNLGARIDKFDNIEDPVFSPRVALILKPHADHAVRVSYNKAFRSPSLINNFLETTIINQLNLGAINPALNGVVYNFPVRAIGNESLTEESTESFEVAYTGIINNRATVSAAVYFTTNRGRDLLHADRPLSRRRAAAGMAAARRSSSKCCRRRAPRRVCTTRRPAVGVQLSAISARYKNKGFELGVDGAVNRAAQRVRELLVSGRARAGLRAVGSQPAADQPLQRRLQLQPGPLPRQRCRSAIVDDAFCQDVLDARFAGPTEAYTQVNGAFGVKFLQRQADDDDQGDQPARRGHPVARVRRHPQAPGDRRAAVQLLDGDVRG